MLLMEGAIKHGVKRIRLHVLSGAAWHSLGMQMLTPLLSGSLNLHPRLLKCPLMLLSITQTYGNSSPPLLLQMGET